jgi:hypothetical protein
MPKNNSTFVTKTYKNAKKYLDDLSPSSSLWLESENWIFRGQRDAEWQLIPSAFRPAIWKQFRGIAGDVTNWKTNVMRMIMETNAVRRFAVMADRQGLLVPGFDETWLAYDTMARKVLVDINKVFSGEQKFPLLHWRPLFGMAQHYGIPTRLLDWSESAKIAAYFASCEAAELIANKSINEEGFIAVWALNITKLEFMTGSKSERIVSVRAPWSSNPNLLAQKGLFTLHEQPLLQDAPPVFEPPEETIQKIMAETKPTQDQPILYCLRLAIKESGRLLKLLHLEGVDAASLFPGYAGVTKCLRELQLHKAMNNLNF